MRITCPNCQATYEVGAADIPQEGIEVECSACLKHWMQKPETGAADGALSGAPTPAPAAPSPAEVVSAAPSAPSSMPAPDPQDLRQALLGNSAPSVSPPAPDYVATPSASAPSFGAPSAVDTPIPTPSFADQIAAASSVPAPFAPSVSAPSAPAVAQWRVPTPPTETMLEQDPLDEILAEVNARAQGHAAGSALENEPDAEPALEEDHLDVAADVVVDPVSQSAETPPETPPETLPDTPLKAEAAVAVPPPAAPPESLRDTPDQEEESADPQAVSGPSFGGVALDDAAPEAPSAPEVEAVRDIPPSIPAYEYVPPASGMPSGPESSAPSAPVVETAAAVSGVAAIWSGFVEQGSEVKATQTPPPPDQAPDQAPESALIAGADSAEVEQEVPIEAALLDTAISGETPEVAEERAAEPPAESRESAGQEELAEEAEPVAKVAPKAPARHWSEVVATPSSPPKAEAQHGMEAFIRELKEEAPASKEASDGALFDAPVDEASEEVFHPWAGEAAPEVSAVALEPEALSETPLDLAQPMADDQAIVPAPEVTMEQAEAPTLTPSFEMPAETAEPEQPLADDQAIEALVEAIVPAPEKAIEQAEAPTLAQPVEMPDEASAQEEHDEPAAEALDKTVVLDAVADSPPRPAPEAVVQAKEAPAVEAEDDFEWDEHPDPEGPELEPEASFTPDPQEDVPNVVEHPAVRSLPSEESLRLKPPEISNVVQANIPQAPTSTMGRPVSAPVETPRKPTPVEATEDIEAAIRAQLSNFPKKNMATPSTAQPEKAGRFGKKAKAAPAAAAPTKPVDPLKAALMDTGQSKGARFGKRAGFITVMALFVLLALLYVLGDSLSAMVPALAPVINGLSGMVDALRGVVGAILGG